MDEDIVVRRSSFKKTDAGLRILAKPRRHHRARRTGADNHIVEFLAHDPSPSLPRAIP